MTLRVAESTAETSEAIKFSPSPRPTNNGQPKRAVIIKSGSLIEITLIAKAPVSSLTAFCVAANKGKFW